MKEDCVLIFLKDEDMDIVNAAFVDEGGAVTLDVENASVLR